MVILNLTDSEAFSLHMCLQIFLHEYPTLDIDGYIHAIDTYVSESLTKELKSDAERISE